MSCHGHINKGINKTNFNPTSPPYFPPTPYNGSSIVMD